MLPYENRRPLPRQVAEAIDYAPEKSVVHRDLKPSNISVDVTGQVKFVGLRNRGVAIGNCGSTWLLMLPFALQFAYNETPAKFLLNATSFVAMALIAAGKFEVRERGVSFGIDSFLWRDIKSFQWRSGSKLELVLKQPLLPRANPDVSVHPDCAPSIHEALRNQLIEVTYD